MENCAQPWNAIKNIPNVKITEVNQSRAVNVLGTKSEPSRWYLMTKLGKDLLKHIKHILTTMVEIESHFKSHFVCLHQLQKLLCNLVLTRPALESIYTVSTQTAAAASDSPKLHNQLRARCHVHYRRRKGGGGGRASRRKGRER